MNWWTKQHPSCPPRHDLEGQDGALSLWINVFLFPWPSFSSPAEEFQQPYLHEVTQRYGSFNLSINPVAYRAKLHMQ